jgi:GAF domain-containing protein/anti-sigma regulatory factor (Ser/Thr protein kinase)
MNKNIETNRQTRLLEAASRVSRSIASILDLNLLLQRTVDIICDEFNFYYAGVFLVDESGEWAVLRSGRGDAGRAMIAEGHKLAVGGNSMIGAAIADRQAHIALDVGEEKVHFKNPHLPLTRSEMALPLIAGDEVIGALTVQSEQESAFKQEDIAALQTMADQLAVAIQNAHLNRKNHDLLRQAERRARLLKAANQVGKEVTSILDLDVLLPRMVDTICETYGFYYAGIFLLDESGKWALLRAGHGEAGRAMLAAGHKLEVGGDSMIGTCIRLGEARIALDVGEERIHFKNPHLPHTRSEMALPLRYGDKILGAVTVQSVEERAFNQDDITTLQTMADHLAVAIQNAYTLQALKKAHAEILRNKVYEALTASTTEAIHWIGNKIVPMTMTIRRMQEELAAGQVDKASLAEDLELLEESAEQIVQVKEQLIGQVRDQKLRPVLLADVLRTAALQRGVPLKMLKTKIAPDAAYVTADSTQLVRALGNFLQNAVEAGARQIVAEAGPGSENETLNLVLQDDGAGMSAEMLSKAWTPFATSKPGHTGLGLPAALHVITQLMGRVEIQSEPGQGTTITMTLPVAHPPKPQAIADAPKTVCLVDDDDAWAKFLGKALGQALRRGAEIDPQTDLILIEEYLENRLLEDVLEAVNKAGVGAKTVIVTAALNVDRMTGYLKQGVRDVILKPYSVEEVPALWR